MANGEFQPDDLAFAPKPNPGRPWPESQDPAG